ncbi:MAG: cytochrome c biogenesis protein ResB [Candidatus Melainabacteria bacterium]|nr:cytochrome c biogenesis protein ResB [Candidatus Melainabacteria bacterium]
MNIESDKNEPKTKTSVKNVLASVKLTIFLMSLTALTVLAGAWCPQESASGKEKVVEQFGPDAASLLSQLGITDIYHSPWFLSLIAMLTLNMIACSFMRVFPRVKLLSKPLPFLAGKDIGKFPVNASVVLAKEEKSALASVALKLASKGFKVSTSEEKLLAEYGKYGRLAATVTHIGLLTLLVGVTITSWTGFSGFQPVLLNSHLDFHESEHSKLWVGKLPDWTVRVDATRREDHPTGEPKQWFSKLTVLGKDGKELVTQEISVNTPLSYKGVDIYQSSWGLDHIVLNFNGNERRLDLRPMGKLYAAFLPLDKDTMMLFSVRCDGSPIKVFAKRPDWEAPRIISEISKDKPAKLGPVSIMLVKTMPVTGLQYKCDPGLPVTYAAFAFIIIGVLMAAIPHRHVWVSLETASPAAKPSGDGSDEIATGMQSAEKGNQKVLYFGGRSVKAKVGFERLVKDLERQIAAEFGESNIVPVLKTHIDVESDSQKQVNPEKAGSKKEQVLAGTASGAGNTENAQGES